MFRKCGLALVVAVGLFASAPSPASAQTMNLQEFVSTANRLPRNPTVLLRSDFGRLKREYEAGLSVVFREQVAARAAGRRPATCIPQKFSMNAEDTLAGLNAIPAARRSGMTITGGVRELMAARFPCP